jgi:hypothetical protein
MKNNNEIYLSDLTNCLKNTYVRLDLDFLAKLLKNASKCESPAINKEFIAKIGGKFNKNARAYNAIYFWINGRTTIPFNKLIQIVEMSDYSLENTEKHIISIKCGRKKGEIYPKFPIIISRGLGSIVGHILGDGSTDKRFNAIFYSNSNVELLQEFRRYMRDIFGIEPRIWVQEKPQFGKTKWMKRLSQLRNIPNGHNVGLFYPRICGITLHEIFGKFAYGKNKCITEQIKNSNRKFKIGLLRAFFDDEGSVRCDSHTARLHQDNKEILEDIRSMLKEFGITSHEIKSYLKRNKIRHYFNINGFKEYHLFYNSIGCTSSKKKEQFELLINKVKNSRFFRKKYRDYLRLVTSTLGQ